MMKHCYYCAVKNVCTIYNILSKYSKDISFSLNSCKYMISVQRNNTVQSVNPIALRKRTAKIKELSGNMRHHDAPQTTKAAITANMKFEVDGIDIS